MAVKVTTADSNDRMHDDGKHILIVDGHLCVQSDDTNDMDATVAIYTPKSWLHATVVNNDRK